MRLGGEYQTIRVHFEPLVRKGSYNQGPMLEIQEVITISKFEYLYATVAPFANWLTKDLGALLSLSPGLLASTLIFSLRN